MSVERLRKLEGLLSGSAGTHYTAFWTRYGAKMEGPFLPSVGLGRRRGSGPVTCTHQLSLPDVGCVAPHTYPGCSACLWLFNSGDTAHFSFFVCKSDHQRKGSVPPDRVSVRIKGRQLIFSSWRLKQRKSKQSLSKVALPSTPTPQLG